MQLKEVRIDGAIKMYGYTRPEVIEITPPEVDAFIELESLKLSDTKVELEVMSKKEIKRNASQFMHRHFKLHKVPYKRLLSNLDYLLLSKISNIKLSTGLCNLTCISIDPFSIPVIWSKKYGENMVISNGNILHCEEFYKNAKIYYQGIILGENPSELSESSYVHEITHTQLTRVKGINGEYYNEEVLPIFLEMVNIYESGSDYLCKVEDVIRITELLYHTSVIYNYKQGRVDANPDELINNSLYATSIVKAYNLFIEYFNGTPALKKYILQCVQNILDSKMPLPELLDEFEIGFESTLKDRKLMKYLTR